MSNREASKVYESIVESVINEVREDFENAGIDEQTLQDLKRNWKLKLSETKVTTFNWDTEVMDTHNSNFMIKEEQQQSELDQGLILPGLESNTLNLNPTPNDNDNTSYNNNSSSNNNNNNNNNNDDNTIPEPSTTTKIKQENDNEDSQENGISPGEKDSSKQEITLEVDDPSGKIAEQIRLQEKKAKRSALLDTDEVGSELDDSDDDYLISEGEDDGPDENLMLCLYEKVTRTKARWKCSLKDGIATINHKDYTFQKAQVEAEWI